MGVEAPSQKGGAGKNVAAALGRGGIRAYRHHELALVVDLGGTDAAANPLGVSWSGPLARAYHRFGMPSNRLGTLAEWLLGWSTGRQITELGLLRSGAVPLEAKP